MRTLTAASLTQKSACVDQASVQLTLLQQKPAANLQATITQGLSRSGTIVIGTRSKRARSSTAFPLVIGMSSEKPALVGAHRYSA